MTINRVGSSITPLADYVQKGKGAKSAAVASKEASDKIEISKEAKIKNSEISDTSKLSLIKDRIDSGFYNSDEVLGKVADSILKELRGA
jgi:anti-sigma28 factor (negative regulator of flagellin synthesis)